MERFRRKTTLVWILGTLGFALTCSAQTEIIATQIRCPAVAGQVNQLLVAQPVASGAAAMVKLQCVQLDKSLSLDTTTTPPTLRVTTGTTALPSFSDSEIPAGLINGTNAAFTVANVPIPAASLTVYLNGLKMSQAVDYTLSGSTITFLAASVPQTGDTLSCSYRF